MTTRFSFLIFFFCAKIAAQTPAYLHYGVGEGLPGNLVYCGIQDKRGLLWFGTDKGLACFDGTRFRTFGMKEGLPDPEVFNLMEDSQGRLWISNYRKKPCYRQNGRFVTERTDSLLAKMKVESALWEFFEDDDQSVWLSGQTIDLVRFFAKQIENKQIDKGVVRPGRSAGKLFFFGINNIFQQQANGVLRIVGRPDAPQRTDINPFKGLSISGKRVLYSFADKLVLLEWRGGQFEEIDRRPGPLGRVFTDRAGRFWVCSLAEGAVCFDNNKRDLSNPVHYFQREKVTAMFDDEQGTHWFCTTNNGIYALPQNVAVNFTERNGLPSNNITALARSPGGGIWAGDDEGNLSEFDRNDRVHITSFGSADGYNRVRRIIPTPEGSRWVLTDEALYHERDGHRRKVEINVSYKTALLQGDKLWFASSGGLAHVSEKTLEVNRVTSGRVVALSEDWDRNVWAGTNEGVLCSKDSFQSDWSELFPALKGRIVAIERAGKDGLWIVTPANGLMLAKVKAGEIISVEIVNERFEKPIDNIQSLFAEPDGKLWLASNRGVFSLDRNWRMLHFDQHDGLADDDVNAVLVHNDTVWAGAVGGLSRLVLKDVKALGNFATLIANAGYRTSAGIHEFHLLDSISVKRNLILPPNASLFEVELSGLDYRSRGNLRYECVTTFTLPSWPYWTIDNLLIWAGNGFKEKPDTTWVSTGSFNLGVSLSPGRYRLQVTAITPGGVRSLQPDGCTVDVRPYRYNTIWFWFFIWLLACYGVWRILRARSAYRKLDAAVSELQLQALQTQMNPHFIGNSINAIQQFFYPPDPMRASEYISLFNRLLRRTLTFSEQTFIPFSEELAYDRDYLEMVKLRFGDNFHFEITGEETISSNTPFPSMLLQPVLENATLHGLAPNGVTELKLDFVLSGKKLVCSITDNGIGFRATLEHQKTDAPSRQSKGLAMLHQKLETLNRRFDLGLQLEMQDLSDTLPPLCGTRVVFRFYPRAVPRPSNQHQSATTVTPAASRPHENH
jgi:ligand-binding sensor domain-containing protein